MACLNEINSYLHKLVFKKNFKVLMATIVKVSEFLYASCKTHTPKTVLQLYNCTWLHHTLCRKLFDQSRLKNITWEAFSLAHVFIL